MLEQTCGTLTHALASTVRSNMRARALFHREHINFLSLSDTPSSNSGSNKDSGNSGNGKQTPGQAGSSRQSSPQDAKEHREQLATGQHQARVKTDVKKTMEAKIQIKMYCFR